MRKIFLVPICVMMCVSFSSCSDNKVDSLNQALSLQGDYINNTIELINSNYQKGFLGIKLDTDISVTENQEEGKLNLLTQVNVDKKSFEEKQFDSPDFEFYFSESFIEENKSINAYYNQKNFTVDVDGSKKWMYDSKYFDDYIKYLEDNKQQDSVVELTNILSDLILNNKLQFVLSWASGEITSDQFYDELVNLLSEYYGANLEYVFTKKDRRLIVLTLDTIKENLINVLDYKGNKKELTLVITKEKLIAFKNILIDNANDSLRQIANTSFSTSYSEYVENFYNRLKKFSEKEFEVETIESIELTLSTNGKIIKSFEISLSLNQDNQSTLVKSYTEVNISSKKIKIDRPTSSGEYEILKYQA